MGRFTTVHIIALISIFYALCILIYGHFDPSEMRDFGIFPWDGANYLSMAEQFYDPNVSSYQARYPFGYRVLFPFIFGGVSHVFDISYIDSVLLVNLSAGYLIMLLMFYLFKVNKVNKRLSIISILLYIVFWIGPLRYTEFYPGGMFAFECLMVLLAFFVLANLHTKKLIPIFVLAIIAMILTSGKEVVMYLALFTLIISFAQYKYSDKLPVAWSFSNYSIDSTYMRNLGIVFIFSILGHVFSKKLVSDSVQEYSVVRNVIEYGWFHLNIAEFLYSFFYGLGPFFLCFLLIISFRKTRSILFEKLKTLPQIRLIIIFCLSGIIFMSIGGTDSERYLLWFMPFYMVIAIKSVEILLPLPTKKTRLYFFVSIGVIGLLWSRFYVPSLPHILFTGDNYRSIAGIKTNYNDELFYGIPLMKKFRYPLKEIKYEDAFVTHGELIIHGDISKSATPQISSLINKKETTLKSPYRDAYKYQINTYPIPFGYSHNQYEMFGAHPYYGHKIIKLVYLMQWLIAYIVLYLFFRRYIVKETLNEKGT